ncbi:E3 ubiquitin-protein ligase ORTHRUS 2 [Ricinus communis]|uniref:RING-type E3 ubiquitin transferase n=1 Tax=Ricinus communis TaxID=3988 RepID=B9SU90_RICCO|nr:E3 ubiquitin-protein ligase ORTHRUS 2 [Ricinus communis]EEF32828.1 zinc finger protein, putative [Ricinus communis]|eukprot:XP_002529559.1 E3 ubiquitin-protein ligase ORTHRUS 2 [Ricinus communis]
MAHDIQIQLPCDGDGVCMKCKLKPIDEETLTCSTCVTPWHLTCLSSKTETLASTLQWECPDCSGAGGGGDDVTAAAPADVAAGGGGSELVTKIKEIEADVTLNEKEKAKKRQALLSGTIDDNDDDDGSEDNSKNDVFDVLDEAFKCAFCMQLPERPVTTPCGHNFCLKCFQRWIGQRKLTCAKCRSAIPPKMASQPRINSSLVAAIRMAKLSKSIVSGGLPKVYHFVHNQNRPDKAYTTERAQRSGKANACSGKIFVTVPPDHFGPIPAENDPERNQGVLVGECWEDRLECRQWGAHLPHVAGIAGQSNYGAQSVALSGGYIDDEDHGEWFLYTGSGGRDLSGNKRTNKEQSFDQKFEKMNEALRLSCRKGYPVRVVRSHKEKRSSYAPESGVRYDGVYRIEKCWRKVGIQGHKVCRYLFVRCDNEPAPWTSDEHGDRPRPLPVIKELAKATDITERKESPSWDFDESDGRWKWKIPPPQSRKPVNARNSEDLKMSRKVIRKAQNTSVRDRLLKEFSCLICRQVMNQPITTPCAHNFCKSCLEGAFTGKTLMRERSKGGRTLRAQKNIMHCPRCPTDISDFLQDPKVNREVMAVIESLQRQTEETVDSVDDSGEEEADGSEENPCVTEAGEDDSEKTAAHNGLENPSKCEPEVAIEQKKENEISAGKTGCGNEHSEEASKLESEVAEDGGLNVQVPAARLSCKRKIPDSGAESREPTVGAKKRNRRGQEATADGNNSPSSPLNVRSSDDDFE